MILSVLFLWGLWHGVSALMPHYYYYIDIDLLSRILCPFLCLLCKVLGAWNLFCCRTLSVELPVGIWLWSVMIDVIRMIKRNHWMNNNNQQLKLFSRLLLLIVEASPRTFLWDETCMFIDSTCGHMLQDVDQGAQKGTNTWMVFFFFFLLIVA